MCYALTNLIKESNCTASQKRFLFMVASYANPDGTNIYPSTHTMAEDFSLSERGVIKMRQDALVNNLIIITRPATSRMPAVFCINIDELRLRKRCEKSVDKKVRGELSSGLGVNSVQPTNHIPINTEQLSFYESPLPVNNFIKRRGERLESRITPANREIRHAKEKFLKLCRENGISTKGYDTEKPHNLIDRIAA